MLVLRELSMSSRRSKRISSSSSGVKIGPEVEGRLVIASVCYELKFISSKAMGTLRT